MCVFVCVCVCGVHVWLRLVCVVECMVCTRARARVYVCVCVCVCSCLRTRLCYHCYPERQLVHCTNVTITYLEQIFALLKAVAKLSHIVSY